MLIGEGRPLSRLEPEFGRRESALLLHVLEATNRSSSVAELEENMLQAIVGAIRLDLACYLSINPQSFRFSLSHPIRVPDALAHALETLEVKQVLSDAEAQVALPLAVPPQLEEEIRSLLRREAYADVVILPLEGEARTSFLLVLAAGTTTGSGFGLEVFGNADLSRAVADAWSGAFRRARLAEALRASEERYRLCIEESPDGFWESDAAGLVLLVNQAGLDMMGLSREQVLGKHMTSIAEEDEAVTRERVKRLERDGFYVDQRVSFHTHDGRAKTANLSVRALKDGTGKIVKYQSVVRDTTGHVLVEEELRKRVSELRAIARIERLIAESADLDTPLREIGREMCEILRADNVSIQLQEGDSMRLVLSDDQRSSRSPLLEYKRQIMAGAEPRVISDRDGPQTDEGQRALLYQLGFAASVGVRLFAQGVTLGVLFVNQRSPRAWTPDEVRLITTFASQIAGALHSANLLGETQARVRELETVAGMSSFAASLTDEDALIDGALQFIPDSLNVDIVGVHLLEGNQFRSGRLLGAGSVPTEPLEMTPMLRELLESRQLFVFDRDHALPPDSYYERQVRGISARAVLAMSLAAGSGVVGLITVGHRSEHVWTTAEKRSFQTLANQLATGIANVRLFTSLEQEREELAATLNSVFSGVFTTDKDGIIQSWNRAAAEMTGYTAQQMRGKEWATVARLANESPDELIFEAMEGGQVVFGLAERSVMTADGRTIQMGEAAAPLRDLDGMIRGAVGAFWDRTRENAAERAKLDFLQEVSHELRNSLTVVLPLAGLLRKKGVKGALRERVIHALSQQLNRWEAFTERLVQYEREGVQQSVREATLDVRTELKRIVQAARLEYPEHLFKLSADPCLAFADEARLETVVTNLIDNSTKYSPAGTRITVEAKAIPGDQIGVRIRNEGPGIPANEQHRIFERGYRTPGSKAQGTGVGLWLVRTKLNEMGGEICVDSDGIQGVTFTFTLRQARSEGAQEQAANPPRRRRTGGREHAKPRPRARRI